MYVCLISASVYGCLKFTHTKIHFYVWFGLVSFVVYSYVAGVCPFVAASPEGGVCDHPGVHWRSDQACKRHTTSSTAKLH